MPISFCVGWRTHEFRQGLGSPGARRSVCASTRLGTAKISATEEWYKIDGDALKPRDGFYDLRITGELWESYFYDSLALMTVDHPAGTEIYTDERFDVPSVRLAVTAVAEPHAINRAVDDQGTDVTETVKALDGKYLDTFGRGPYQGVTRDHYVEVDLGNDVPVDKPLWLIAKGWLHPSDSTVNVAMGQGEHARPHWLSLEVPDGRGGWAGGDAQPWLSCRTKEKLPHQSHWPSSLPGL